MRKIIVSVLALCLAFPALRAQGRHEINLSIGGASSESLFMTANEGNYNDLYSIYEPHYRLESGPVVTLDYHFKLNKVVHLGAELNYAFVQGRSWYNIGGQQGQQFKTNLYSVLPQVKLRIPGPPHFRLYGKLAAGVQWVASDLKARQESPVQFAWNITPLGFEWGGNRVYGMAELCVGNVLLGGRLGIGFRF